MLIFTLHQLFQFGVLLQNKMDTSSTDFSNGLETLIHEWHVRQQLPPLCDMDIIAEVTHVGGRNFETRIQEILEYMNTSSWDVYSLEKEIQLRFPILQSQMKMYFPDYTTKTSNSISNELAELHCDGRGYDMIDVYRLFIGGD